MITIRPKTTWPGFLQSAPYFLQVFWDLVDYEKIAELSPLVRAAHCYDIFDAEVSNGGVMQYFYNQAGKLPFFDLIPQYIAEHPDLKTALPFVQEVHAVWDKLQPEVEAARLKNEWPEDLFAQFNPQFESLTKAFYAVNHEVTQRLCSAIVQKPEDYFEIENIPELKGKGVEHILLQDGTQRLRFEDGFPVGPNIFEYNNGACGVVWFSTKRELLQVEMPQVQTRNWIYYPSLSSGTWRFQEKQLMSYQSTRALWKKHGNSEAYNPAGLIVSQQYYSYGEEKLFESFTDAGQLFYRAENKNGEKIETRFWPNGAISTTNIKTATGQTRYTGCWNDVGQSFLNEKMTGQFKSFLAVYEGRHIWLEGQLVEGYLHGAIQMMTSLPDGSDVKLGETTIYKNGRKHEA